MTTYTNPSPATEPDTVTSPVTQSASRTHLSTTAKTSRTPPSAPATATQPLDNACNKVNDNEKGTKNNVGAIGLTGVGIETLERNVAKALGYSRDQLLEGLAIERNNMKTRSDVKTLLDFGYINIIKQRNHQAPSKNPEVHECAQVSYPLHEDMALVLSEIGQERKFWGALHIARESRNYALHGRKTQRRAAAFSQLFRQAAEDIEKISMV
ncbi:hypothetical protein BJ508DRAFT_361915 [Ascobolus immersus RN42]|uniref:Uncharacterized protein n=1 Tax=Ascobolus immersus RN42 TaxID=1160509 RepID=A0A3N4I791_ASCIM|nr:hypothetical protein BJ508DRAFT_361915 [Ascobolus immersus RN42]